MISYTHIHIDGVYEGTYRLHDNFDLKITDVQEGKEFWLPNGPETRLRLKSVKLIDKGEIFKEHRSYDLHCELLFEEYHACNNLNAPTAWDREVMAIHKVLRRA